MTRSPGNASSYGDGLDPRRAADLRALFATKPAQGAAFVTVFLDEAHACVTELWRATKVGDVVAVRKVAHTLRGSAANIGARRLRELCDQIHDVAESKGAADVDLIQAVDDELERVRAALSREFPDTE